MELLSKVHNSRQTRGKISAYLISNIKTCFPSNCYLVGWFTIKLGGPFSSTIIKYCFFILLLPLESNVIIRDGVYQNKVEIDNGVDPHSQCMGKIRPQFVSPLHLEAS